MKPSTMHMFRVNYRNAIILCAVLVAVFAYAKPAGALYYEMSPDSAVAPVGEMTLNGVVPPVPCTATLVASDVILTSLACASFNVYYTLTVPGPGIVGIVTTHTSQIDNFILKKLARDVPSNIVPVQLSNSGIVLGGGTYIYGWGEGYQGHSAYDQRVFVYNFTTSPFSRNPICNGDVGAPVIQGGRITGIVLGNTGGSCGQPGGVVIAIVAPSFDRLLGTINTLHGVPKCSILDIGITPSGIKALASFTNLDTSSAEAMISLDARGFSPAATIPPGSSNASYLIDIPGQLMQGSHNVVIRVSNRRAIGETCALGFWTTNPTALNGPDSVPKGGSGTFSAPACPFGYTCSYNWRNNAYASAEPQTENRFASSFFGNGTIVNQLATLLQGLSRLPGFAPLFQQPAASLFAPAHK